MTKRTFIKTRVKDDGFTTKDFFGYDQYQKTIVDMITQKDFPTPLTFGIFGEWGQWQNQPYAHDRKGIAGEAFGHSTGLVQPMAV